MSSPANTSAINDPLRPRLLNASCVQVTPQRLAARFEPHAQSDICLTARVNRAQEAVSAKVQAELPTDSDEDEFGPDDPFTHLPAAMQPAADGTPAQVAIPTSGSQALEYMKRTSAAGTRPDHSYIIGVMLSLVPLSMSDPHLFRAHRGHIQSCEALFIEWERSAQHKSIVKRFVEDFKTLKGIKLTASMELFFEYLVEVKKASAQSAVTAMIYHYTFERRSFSAEPQVSKSMRSHENQLVLWLVKYMETPDDAYVDLFRADCISRSLDLTTVQECTRRSLVGSYPGFNRLAMCETETMTMSWSWLLRDLCAFMGGAKINNELNIRDVNSDFFVPDDVSKPHGLRFEVLPDGSFTDTHEWFADESSARSAINVIANKAGIPSWFVDEYKTIGNSLRALKTAVSMDLYNAWWIEYRRSDDVPDDVVIPDGEWPIIEMSLFKSLLRLAETDLSKNIPLQRERAAAVKKSPPKAPQQGAPAEQPARIPGAADAVGKCRICNANVGHNTKNCPKRSGLKCDRFANTGKCMHGNRCKFEHDNNAPTRAPAPGAPAPAVPAAPSGAPPPYKAAPIPQAAQPGNNSAMPTAEPLKDFTPMSEVGTQEVSCRNQTAPGCTPHFTLDMSKWGKMVNDMALEGKEFCLPKSCDNCRAYDKQHRSAAMMTGQDVPYPDGADGESHGNDGANDDYDCYGDYDMSMSQAGMVTSIGDDEVEVDWWKPDPVVSVVLGLSNYVTHDDISEDFEDAMQRLDAFEDFH